MKKSELRQMIREILKEELVRKKSLHEVYNPIEYCVTYRLTTWSKNVKNEEAFVDAEDALEAINLVIENILDDENNEDIPVSERIEESEIKVLSVVQV